MLSSGEPVGREDGNNQELEGALRSFGNTLSELAQLDESSDADVQAAATDFLDFTDYFPADQLRSLALIDNLEETRETASREVNELTKAFRELSSHDANATPSPSDLRAAMSQRTQDLTQARNYTQAETIRMDNNVDRHLNRAELIRAKLEAMVEAYSKSPVESAVKNQPTSPQAVRSNKIMLNLSAAGGRSSHKLKRAPRIIVPGEVLAPYDLEYYYSSSESDDSDTEDDDIVMLQQTSTSTGSSKPKQPKTVKDVKSNKEGVPKQPKLPKDKTFGTNVHSAVAGISTSNALKLLPPPPPDAKIGGDDLPWGRLTQYELAILRKKMKKNAVWNPSDTMIKRELRERGRNRAAYDAAKALAEESGLPWEHPPWGSDSSGMKVENERGTDFSGDHKDEDGELSNRGMKLNEQKKRKRELERLQAAQLAAPANPATPEHAEDVADKMKSQLQALPNLFKSPISDPASKGTKKQETMKTPLKPAPKKQNVEISTGTDITKVEGEASKPAGPLVKRIKVETPVPPPSSARSRIRTVQLVAKAKPPSESSPTPVTIQSTPSQSTASSVNTNTTTTTIPLQVASPPRKSSTPILPPAKETRKDLKRDANKPVVSVPAPPLSNPIVTRNRTSAAPTPVPEALPPVQPISRGKAASAEPAAPSAGKERLRRASTVHNTPTPEVRPPSRQAGRRAKRPAPGPVTAGIEGSAAVSVGKRSAAPRKKAGPKKQQKDMGKDVTEVWDEIDDEGNIIDPNEPRYCLCNRVSFGIMIGCENDACEKEWFHLECVGLQEIPPRTTKWYCPDCRITLGIGEKGEVTARGKKK